MFNVNLTSAEVDANLNKFLDMMATTEMDYETPSIKRVIFNNLTTIVFFMDGDKVVVKCAKDDMYDREKAVMSAVMKKIYGRSVFKQISKAIDNAERYNERDDLGSCSECRIFKNALSKLNNLTYPARCPCDTFE